MLKALNKRHKLKTITQLILDQKKDTLPDRGFKRTHASDLTKDDFCPRKVCLVRKYKKELPPQRVAKATQLTFDMGNHIADLVIHNWAAGKVIGDWKCRNCGTKLLWRKEPHHFCNCGCKLWHYAEVRFEDLKSGATGGVDMFVELQPNRYTAVELKIMATEKFNDLVAPLAEHRARTQLYLELIKYSDHPQKSVINTDLAKVFYVSRGHGKKTKEFGLVPFKEFDVLPDPEAARPYRLDAVKIKYWEETGTLPPRVCDFEICKQARSCPVANECFHKEKD